MRFRGVGFWVLRGFRVLRVFGFGVLGFRAPLVTALFMFVQRPVAALVSLSNCKLPSVRSRLQGKLAGVLGVSGLKASGCEIVGLYIDVHEQF